MKDNRNPWKIGFFIVAGILCIFLLTSMDFYYSADEQGLVDVLADIGGELHSINITLQSIRLAISAI